MRRIGLLGILALVVPATADEPCVAKARRAAFANAETQLVDVVEATSLAAFHEKMASEPHRAGTAGDRKVIEFLADSMRQWGLEVEVQEIDVYLAKPVSASLSLVKPMRLALRVKEKPVDRFSAHPDGSIGWNAYSGSGVAQSTVVYANYGRQEDFAKLDELGVSVKGKIVIARYGGNFRGYKAKFAEARGAAGLILYTDPHDNGYFRGLGWPEGGYANPSCIQRGSILTLPYRGDPLTPFQPAEKGVERLDPATLAFPKIPVQPVGWESAQEILQRMTGRSVPQAWQGALPFRYRIEGGANLIVRVEVQQKRELVRTANVVGVLKGTQNPDQLVIAGAHHDAWDFGAGDPLSGTIVALEAARAFAAAAKAGRRTRRSLAFGFWAAEEYGIIGSVEWCEKHAKRLFEGGVAYLNLDMATMGKNLGASAAPSLRPVINRAIHAETGRKLAKFGDLGGGSDHIGFYCHLSIPSAGLSSRGARGNSYHSLYDHLDWYRRVVGPDYKPARTLTRVVCRTMHRLADADVLPLDMVAVGASFQKHLGAIADRARKDDLVFSRNTLDAVAKEWLERAEVVQDALYAMLEKQSLSANAAATINRELLRMERAWHFDRGLPGRPWFRNLYAASDENSGYAAWVLPGLRGAVERGVEGEVESMGQALTAVLAKLRASVERAHAALR